MAIFFAIALKQSASALDAAVESQFPEDTYKIESGKWAINTDLSTARQVSTKLGIRETQNHIVVSARGYSGRASLDLWEWLSAQSAKTDG